MMKQDWELFWKLLTELSPSMADLFNVAPAGFWPRGQNPRRHARIPHVYTYKGFQKSKKCVCSLRTVLDLMKLGAQGGLG